MRLPMLIAIIVLPILIGTIGAHLLIQEASAKRRAKDWEGIAMQWQENYETLKTVLDENDANHRAAYRALAAACEAPTAHEGE